VFCCLGKNGGLIVSGKIHMQGVAYSLATASPSCNEQNNFSLISYFHHVKVYTIHFVHISETG
jgi:hypothetical protein